MLRFHTGKELTVYWASGAADLASLVGNGLKVPSFQANQHLLDLSHATPQQQAEKLRSKRIGVLIDLDGWIGDEPPRRVSALNPAPVRSHWLGWAGTAADPTLQYMVSDATITRPGASHTGHYTERFVLLPRSYQLNDHAQLYTHVLTPSHGKGRAGDVAGQQQLASAAGGAGNASGGGGGVEGSEAGVDEGMLLEGEGGEAGASVRRRRKPPPRGVTLANFNQLMKISPDIFGVWAGAMARTRHSRLMLLSGVTSVHVQYPSAGRNLNAEMAARGLAKGRLLRGPVRRKGDHLARASQCDLAVDTLSYNSHTTGSDALWAGLPLVTQPGRNFASRVASSLTSSLGVPNGQVESLKGYEDLIHLLARPSSDPVAGHEVVPFPPPPPQPQQRSSAAAAAAADSAADPGANKRPSSGAAAAAAASSSSPPPAAAAARQGGSAGVPPGPAPPQARSKLLMGGVATILQRHHAAASGVGGGLMGGGLMGGGLMALPEAEERPEWRISEEDGDGGLSRRHAFGTTWLLADSPRLLPHLTGPRPWGTFMKPRPADAGEDGAGGAGGAGSRPLGSSASSASASAASSTSNGQKQKRGGARGRGRAKQQQQQ
jgi:hypothetical protein